MSRLERQYQVLHRLGIRPWASAEPPEALRQLVEGNDALMPGTALDLGCGTGEDAIYLAQHGWRVIAVDVSPQAISIARSRSRDVHWRAANVTTLATSSLLRTVVGCVNLLLDIGCLHGLDNDGRNGWARTVEAAATPGAIAVIRAATPARRRITPAGISTADIATLLGPAWTATSHPSDAYVFQRSHAPPWPKRSRPRGRTTRFRAAEGVVGPSRGEPGP